MPGALNVDDKYLIHEIYYGCFKCFASVQRTTDTELSVLLSKENGISRDFFLNIYILFSNLTKMGKCVAL